MFVENFSVILILFAISSNAFLEWGEVCRLENGSKGVCIEALKCQQAYRSIKLRMGNKPKLCQYKGKETTVCCDDGNITDITGVRSVQACQQWEMYRPVPINFAGGGVPTTIIEFPHMAALGYDVIEENETYWGCGGSLISKKFVLTAAHCLHSIDFGPVKHVRLGDTNLKSTDDVSDPQDFLVAATHKHPLYKRPVKYHDIALIELDRKAVISEYVQPACLNIKLNTLNNNLIATGWGLLSFNGKAADVLQKLYINQINNTDCKKSYSVNDRVLSEGIQEEYQICAGFKGRDTCQGDSGGPLQSLEQLTIYFIHGVTSFGKPCLLTNSPGVYTRVANYIDWIEPIVWPNTK